jgi:hypothetical protein
MAPAISALALSGQHIPRFKSKSEKELFSSFAGYFNLCLEKQRPLLMGMGKCLIYRHYNLLAPRE